MATIEDFVLRDQWSGLAGTPYRQALGGWVHAGPIYAQDLPGLVAKWNEGMLVLGVRYRAERVDHTHLSPDGLRWDFQPPDTRWPRLSYHEGAGWFTGEGRPDTYWPTERVALAWWASVWEVRAVDQITLHLGRSCVARHLLAQAANKPKDPR